MKAPLTIRKETPDDIAGIQAMVKAAFGRPAEADLVDRLRHADALTLSTVGVVGGRVVGHVAFSPVTVGARHAGLALAPVAVASEHRGQGVASSLIRWSMEECRRSGHGLAVVLGEPAFYQRFGFMPAKRFGIECPFPIPEGTFMVAELSLEAATGCRGKVRYRREFDGL